MNSILVVCEGNICRSPMAQGILATALPQTHVTSAGLGAMIGKPAEKEAIELMRERGIEIGAHRAVQITRDMCLKAEMVLVMETQQRRHLETLFPEAVGRVFRLGEHTYRDVPDPYRKSPTAFREALTVIDDGISEWLQRIRKI